MFFEVMRAGKQLFLEVASPPSFCGYIIKEVPAFFPFCVTRSQACIHFLQNRNMSPIKVYNLKISPPCRAVLLTAKQLGVDVTIKDVNLLTGEHLTPDFLNMNPSHTVPVIDDNGFYLWESRAIMGYLADRYAKDDKLFPKNVKDRAIVDQMLYFDAATLYVALYNYYFGTLFLGKLPTKEAEERLHEKVGILDTILGKTPFAAGQRMTIADISILASVTLLEALDISYKKYANLSSWLAKMKKEVTGYKEINQPGLDAFGDFFRSKRDELLGN